MATRYGLVRPRALRAGDRLAIVAPASSFDRQEFDDGVGELERLGFEPVFDESIFVTDDYLAGPAAARAQALHRAWHDPSVAGIIAVRGGYGSGQLIPLLDAGDIRRHAKPFIGYSDLTAMLMFLTGFCGTVSFHGPMLAGRLGRGEAGYDRRSFEHALCRTEPMGELAPDGLESVVAGEAEGMLLGGTLTMLLASLGTPYAFDPPPGYILFLDEVGERPYRLDRMITQMRQSGLLSRASAIVVGELPRCDEPSGSPAGRHVVGRLLADFPGPVLMGFPSGHTTGPAWTLPFGVAARVIGGSSPRLVIEEAAVQ